MKKYLKWIVVVTVVIAIFGEIGSSPLKDENNEDNKKKKKYILYVKL